MDILYADEKLAVCLKVPGLLSTDEPGGMPSLLRAALETETIYTVHRLDAAVGGVMVYARTRHAASDLSREIRTGEFYKEYRAVACAALPEDGGVLRDLLWRDTRRRVTRVAAQPGPGVQEAELEYRVLARREGLSLVKIVLHTGRTHQIRCQFASRGWPLWGDGKYGAAEEGPIALWSCALGFRHPVTGESLRFAAPPPAIEPWTLFMGEGL
ncbi:MAG: RluA family pseudouridine synthase [Oscillospiraceae bacterium]|nr:RluA family pseudouridine synthase [Oscillospiraceae bacterium]